MRVAGTKAGASLAQCLELHGTGSFILPKRSTRPCANKPSSCLLWRQSYFPRKDCHITVTRLLTRFQIRTLEQNTLQARSSLPGLPLPPACRLTDQGTDTGWGEGGGI